MRPSTRHPYHQPPIAACRRCNAFTLIEMLVAVSILILVLLGVSVVFSAAGRAMRTSNSTMELDSNCRAVLRQISSDIQRIDRDAFLIIRCNRNNPASGTYGRMDQIAFIASGAYRDRTGTSDMISSPNGPSISGLAAFIWYGHALRKQDLADYMGSKVGNGALNSTTFADQATGVQLMDQPAFVMDSPYDSYYLARRAIVLHGADNGNPQRLAETGGIWVPAHPDIRRGSANVPVGNGESDAHISSGRASAATLTPGQIMAQVRAEKFLQLTINSYYDKGFNPESSKVYHEGGVLALPPITSYPTVPVNSRYDGCDLWYEARNFAFRPKIITAPREGSDGMNLNYSFINGMARMSPILLQGAVAFEIEWTDGTVDANGILQWYGPSNPQRLWPPVDSADTAVTRGSALNGFVTMLPMTNPFARPLADAAGQEHRVFPQAAPGSGYTTVTTPIASQRDVICGRDSYTAVFSVDRKDRWPKCVRIKLRAALPGNEHPLDSNSKDSNKVVRTYTQLIWLPR